jgi:hypothetical protein
MRRPQISLRTVLWITALLAISLGWWADHSRMASRYQVQKRRGDIFNRNNEELSRALYYMRQEADRRNNPRLSEIISPAAY